MNVRVWFRRNPWGRLTHYYHFVFGGLIPFHEWIVRRPHVSGVRLPSLGPMGPVFASVPSFARLKLIGAGEKIDRNVLLRGMDYGSGNYRRRSIEGLRNEILDGVAPGSPIDVLFVDRWRPPADYFAQYGKRHEGAMRRSLTNAAETCKQLREAGLHTELVYLERLTLLEQAALFSRARTIVAQHGAGLANLIFATPRANVIEIGPRGRKHFHRLACCMRLRYRPYHVGANHITVDPSRLLSMVHETPNALESDAESDPC